MASATKPSTTCLRAISCVDGDANREISSVHTENPAETTRPTQELTASLQFAVDRINEGLFAGDLPEVIATIDRRAVTGGYYLANALQNRDGRIVDQIALSPTFISLSGSYETLRMIARLSVRQWRKKVCVRVEKGRLGTPGYCDKHWARQMKAIGLQPTSTGDPAKPDDCQTGYGIGDIVIEGGPFDLLAREMVIAHEGIAWSDSAKSIAQELGSTAASGADDQSKASKPRRTREKFTCRTCGLNAYAKPTAVLICGTCQSPMPVNHERGRSNG